ncbi:MAG TPA: CPBP family intramembrane glutamic endopeptidase [bacterium]|nr:CPBP family intramembrane glutamic endopeptidase [bacterium]
MNAKTAFGWGVLCWVFYLSARTAIQHLVLATDYASNVRQDELITLFRLACALAASFIYWRCWTLKELLQWKRTAAWVWLGGLLLIAGNLTHALAYRQPAWFDWRVIGIDWVVAFNEEVSYRGLFQRSLMEWKGKAWAEWGGSLMFTAMHLGYQPLSRMGYIFLWGLAAAKLRSRGAAMGSLIIIHWLADSADVVCWKKSAEPLPSLEWVSVGCLLVVLGLAWLYGRERVRPPAMAV